MHREQSEGNIVKIISWNKPSSRERVQVQLQKEVCATLRTGRVHWTVGHHVLLPPPLVAYNTLTHAGNCWVSLRAYVQAWEKRTLDTDIWRPSNRTGWVNLIAKPWSLSADKPCHSESFWIGLCVCAGVPHLKYEWSVMTTHWEKASRSEEREK